MAPDVAQALPLGDFVTKAISDLESGAATPADILSQTTRYSAFEPFFATPERKRLLAATATDPDAFRHSLISVLQEVQLKLLPETIEASRARRLTPDQPATPAEITEWAHRMNTMSQRVANKKKAAEQLFKERIVAEFARSNPETIVNRLKRDFEMLGPHATESHIVTTLRPYGPTPVVQQMVSSHVQKNQQTTQVLEAFFGNYQKIDPTLVPILEETLISKGAPDAAKTATKTALQMTVLQADHPDQQNQGSSKIFQALAAEKGTSGLLAVAGDAFATVFPQRWGPELAKAIEKLTQEDLVTIVGKEVAASDTMRRALAATQSLRTTAAGAGTSGGLRNIIGDLFGSMKEPANEATVEYFKLIQQIATHPEAFKDTPNPFIQYILHDASPGPPAPQLTSAHFYLLVVFPAYPEQFTVEHSGMMGHLAIHWATMEGRNLLVSLLGGAVKKQVAQTVLTGAATAASAAPTTGGFSLLAWAAGIGTSLLGGFGKFMNMRFTGDTLTDWGIGCLVGGVAIFSIVGTLAFAILRDNPLFVGAFQGGAGTDQAIVYNGQAPPISAIQGCPVSNTPGHISQCPNTDDPDGSHFHAHSWSNAYDVAVPLGTPVYATHNGYLVSYHSGDAMGQGTGYGNHVILVGKDASGKQFFTIYGHLLSISPGIKSLCNNQIVCTNPASQSVVSDKMLLGLSDNTGNSTGPHLHYEVRNTDGSKPQFQLPAGCGGYVPGQCK